MADLLNYNPARALDSNGDPVSGALAYFYDTGTTSRRNTYSDEDLTTVNPWPLVANANGVFGAAFVAGGTAVKVIVRTPEGTMLTGYPIDPVMRQQTGTTGAGDVPFVPTVDIPEDNVQDAIERVQANLVAPLADYGIGITGTGTLLSNIDLTNIASGAYIYDGTTLGTYPAGITAADGGIIVLWRRNAANARMFLFPATQDAPGYERRMASSVWGSWVRYADDAAVVKTTGAQTIAGAKTFSAQAAFDTGLTIDADTGRAAFVSDGGATRTTAEWLISATSQWSLNLQTDGDLNWQPVAGQTFQVGGNLVWHAGNDGAGSGLDADTLDTFEAAAFPRLAASNAFTAANSFAAATTFNHNVTINPNGFNLTFNSDGTVSRSTLAWQIGGVAKWSANLQTDGDLNFSPTGSETLRVSDNLVWHAGNDGAGSGLDADLLDGVQGSAYAALAGAQSFTGAKTFDANVTVSTDTALVSFDGSTGADRTMFRGRLGATNHWALVLQSDGDLNFNNVSGSKSLQWDGNEIYTSANIKSGLNASGTAPIYAVRAWVDFKGTGTVAIRNSGNVSSITDLGTGHYRVNLTTGMPSVNYCVMATCNQAVAGTAASVSERGGTIKTASQFTLNTFSGSTETDVDFVYAAAIG